MDALIERDILSVINLRINSKEAIVTKTDTPIFLTVTRVDNKDEIINIGSTADENSWEIVKELINDYKPLKTKSTEVKFKIIMKNETLIFEKLCRLPLHEQEIVNK